MFDRTSLDLRLAEHRTTTARINRSAWQYGRPARRPLRTALASALVSLATRLAPVSPAPRNQPGQEQPAAA